MLQTALTHVLILATSTGFTAAWDAPSSIAQEATFYVATTRAPDAFPALRTVPAPAAGTQERYAQSKQQQQDRPSGRTAGTDAQNAQDRYNQYKRQQEEQAANGDRENSQIRKIEQQIDRFPIEASSDGPVRELCRATLQSNDLSATGKASIKAKCFRTLEAISYKKAAQAEQDNERNSEAIYKKLATELEAMPPTAETVQQLRQLLVNNNYRLPQLSYHYQNNYFERIQAKLRTIEASMSERIYSALVDKKLAVPPALRNSRILNGLSGISLMQFLCGALISTQKVTLTENGRLLDIGVDDLNFRFSIVRYIPDQKIIIPADSPLQGGTTALSLEAVTENGRPLNIGNPMAFVTNFYSQWTPQLAAYLRQSGAP